MEKANKVEMLVYFMLTLVIVLSIINNFIIMGQAEKIGEAEEIAREFLRPADLKVTKILLSDCEECFDIEAALENIKKQNVNITEEKTIYADEKEAKELISKYGIEKIPAIILSGEINKTEQLKSFFDNIGDFSDERTAIFTRSFGILKISAT